MPVKPTGALAARGGLEGQPVVHRESPCRPPAWVRPALAAAQPPPGRLDYRLPRHRPALQGSSPARIKGRPLRCMGRVRAPLSGRGRAPGSPRPRLRPCAGYPVTASRAGRPRAGPAGPLERQAPGWGRPASAGGTMGSRLRAAGAGDKAGGRKPAHKRR
jgi:hypothetical protein